MEPLDPKAGLMRLADEYAQWFSADEHYSTEHRRHNRTESRTALSAAIDRALADARRLALEEASSAVCRVGRAVPTAGGVMALWQSDVLTAIRALIDGKTT